MRRSSTVRRAAPYKSLIVFVFVFVFGLLVLKRPASAVPANCSTVYFVSLKLRSNNSKGFPWRPLGTKLYFRSTRSKKTPLKQEDSYVVCSVSSNPRQRLRSNLVLLTKDEDQTKKIISKPCKILNSIFIILVL